MFSLEHLLEQSSQLHRHLCPRQVLGVRMGMYAGEILNLELPQENKRLYTIMETDGCAADGVSTATNCWVGRRTMRVEDYGKVAATFVDTKTGKAIRLVPRSDVRCLARDYAPEAKNKWEAQLLGYQQMPSEMLFSVHHVQLLTPIESIISRAGVKAICDVCGEEIMNEHEVKRDDMTLCRSCAGEGYYLMLAESVMISVVPA